jgi:hypothetical protein
MSGLKIILSNWCEAEHSRSAIGGSRCILTRSPRVKINFLRGCPKSMSELLLIGSPTTEAAGSKYCNLHGINGSTRWNMN